MDQDPDRRLTARGEERRRQIIEVATRLFAHNGYHPTSVADVVDAVGVGKGVFYWYFSSKEALLREILREGQLARRRGRRTHRPPVVRTLRTCHPADGVCEVSAVVWADGRVRALALRMTGVDGRWLITAWELG